MIRGGWGMHFGGVPPARLLPSLPPLATSQPGGGLTDPPPIDRPPPLLKQTVHLLRRLPRQPREQGKERGGAACVWVGGKGSIDQQQQQILPWLGRILPPDDADADADAADPSTHPKHTHMRIAHPHPLRLAHPPDGPRRPLAHPGAALPAAPRPGQPRDSRRGHQVQRRLSRHGPLRGLLPRPGGQELLPPHGRRRARGA